MSASPLYKFQCTYFLYQFSGTAAEVDLEISEKEAKGTITFSTKVIPPRTLASSSTENFGNFFFGQLSSPRFGMRRNSSTPPQDRSGKINFRKVKHITIHLQSNEGFCPPSSVKEKLVDTVVEKILAYFPNTKKKHVLFERAARSAVSVL